MSFFDKKNNNYVVKNALIFDIDGTLWDATGPVSEAWDLVASKSKYHFHISQKQIFPCMGRPMSDFPKMLFPPMGKEEAESLLKESLEFENNYIYTHPGNLYEGVEETLKKLSKDFDLLILSNCQQGYIEAFLSASKLGYLFKNHICWGDNHKSKSENMLLLVKQGGYEKAMYVGDTLYDEEETHKAGFRFAFASYGFGQCMNPDYVLKKFSDLDKAAEDAFSE